MPLARGIFEADETAIPRERSSYKSDNAFTFKSGYAEGGVPKTVKEWRVTTGDPEKAARIAELYGGTVTEWETTKDEFLQVFTSAVEVPILIEGPDAIDTPHILWGPNGQPVEVCDGVVFLRGEPDEIGKPCLCPRGITLKERKALARKGRVGKPNIKVRVTLMDDQDLGLGTVESGSWDFYQNLYIVDAELRRIGGPAVGILRLNHVQYSTDTRDVSYRHPEIHSLKSYNDAVAEDAS